MIHSHLITPEQLKELIQTGTAVVVDCRFDLADPEKGKAEWRLGHVPGAHYADLDKDLSSPVTADSGRHPLPDSRSFARFLSSIGWTEEKRLVAYDAANSMFAARLWWLMRFFGHESQVLDGGLVAWQSAGFALQQGDTPRASSDLSNLEVLLESNPRMIVSAQDVVRNLDSAEFRVLDARAPDRFRGENETLDTKAGHIPGARNFPFARNLQADGSFRPVSDLNAQFEESLGGLESHHVVHSCGSGVTACHNLLAMEVAGKPGSRLYPGSWSEWIRDARRPVETG